MTVGKVAIITGGSGGIGEGTARTVTEALASLVEQSAYTWFAQEELNEEPIPVKTAAQVVTGIWYRTFFGDQWDSHKNVEK